MGFLVSLLYYGKGIRGEGVVVNGTATQTGERPYRISYTTFAMRYTRYSSIFFFTKFEIGKKVQNCKMQQNKNTKLRTKPEKTNQQLLLQL